MANPAVCPRCREVARPPTLMTSGWRCDHHGVVTPLHLPAPSARTLAQLASRSGVPVWLPHPAPTSWVITGVGYACDNGVGYGGDSDDASATVIALSGPSPLGGGADLLIVAEKPGVGLGTGYAGLPGTDAGPLPTRPSDAIVRIGAHPTRLWQIPGPADRSSFVGEAEGCWLWLILWPQDADVVLLERLTFCDMRFQSLPALDFGAQTPRLAAMVPDRTASN